MSYKNKSSELHQCASDGTRATSEYLCSTTCLRGNTEASCQCTPGSPCEAGCQPSRCACIQHDRFCGHELANTGWRGYQNETLYECVNGSEFTELEKCQTTCRSVDRHSVCGGKCISGKKYCGSLLHRMGYEGYINESLYLCVNIHLPLTDTGETNVLCHEPCTPKRSYCGFEIDYAFSSQSVATAHGKYICKEGGSLSRIEVCSTCFNVGYGAYCSCTPSWRYCGRIIDVAGWSKQHVSIHTNDTIYRCVTETKADYVETCPPGECRKDYQHAHCLCIANRTYCGHELYQHYNSDDTYLYPQHVYRCTESRQRVIEEQRCTRCFRLNDSPKCRQECTVGRYYCGSELLQLEGWQGQDVDTNYLYKCDNSTLAEQIMKCSDGCIPASSDPAHDAYCAPPKIAWYWFLIGIGVPVIVISLGLVLVRVGLHNRRLKRMIEASRIDASQLVQAPGEPLGEGQFGMVVQAMYKPKEGSPVEVAVKVSQGKTDDASKLACANCFLQEVIALDILKHQNIIQAFGICTNYKDQMGNTVPALVLEYVNGGSAISYVRSERARLIGSDLLQIFTDVCQGGAHLCKMGIIHRDIGARNVLVQKDPNTGRAKLAKLTDFGLAKDIGKLTSIYKSANALFHFRYTAPEGFRGEFSSKSDVWSFAVLMWELYTVLEETPQAADSVVAQVAKSPMPYSEISEYDEVRDEVRGGLRLQQPKMTPNDIYKKMLQCWDKSPEARPSFKELIRFFNSKQGAHMIAPSPSSRESETSVSNGAHQEAASLLSLPEANDENLHSADTEMQAPDQTVGGYTRAR